MNIIFAKPLNIVTIVDVLAKSSSSIMMNHDAIDSCRDDIDNDKRSISVSIGRRIDRVIVGFD